MDEFRIATAADIPPAAATLSKAFENYPWTNWTVAADNRVDRIRRIQELCLIHIAIPFGVVLVNDAHTAVLAATKPGATEKVEHQVWGHISTAMGNSPSQNSHLELPDPEIENSWSLATIGVRPDAQGQELGTRIIKHFLRTIDEASSSPVPVHLETSDPLNVKLYERLGFYLYATTRCSDTPTVWSMQRH